MSGAAKTVWLFGIYLLIEGFFLMLSPTWVLEDIGIPDPESVWRIVLGFVVAVLGYYYVRNAKENLTPFFGFHCANTAYSVWVFPLAVPIWKRNVGISWFLIH